MDSKAAKDRLFSHVFHPWKSPQGNLRNSSGKILLQLAKSTLWLQSAGNADRIAAPLRRGQARPPFGYETPDMRLGRYLKRQDQSCSKLSFRGSALC